MSLLPLNYFNANKLFKDGMAASFGNHTLGGALLLKSNGSDHNKVTASFSANTLHNRRMGLDINLATKENKFRFFWEEVNDFNKIPFNYSGTRLTSTPFHKKGRNINADASFSLPGTQTLDVAVWLQRFDRAEQIGGRYGLGPEDTYLSPAPLYHTAPLAYTTAAHRLGATVVVMPKFDAEEALKAIQDHRVTMTQMVPTMFVRMLKLPEEVRKGYDLSSLRHVVHAAAPCPVPVKHAMIDWMGPIVFEYYGGSEGNGSTAITSEEWLRKPGSVGKANWGTIHICNDAGDELPAGEQGIVYFEGGWDFKYLGDDDKTRDARNPRHPTWSTLGDVGYLDADGYLFLTDRKSYMIISGGVNIYPQEVENLLITHPRVADAAVIGVPNPDFGEEVKAVVQPLDPADATPAFAEELIAFCKEHLSPIKCPRSVDFDPALPRLDNGKLYKRLIKDRYWKKD